MVALGGFALVALLSLATLSPNFLKIYCLSLSTIILWMNAKENYILIEYVSRNPLVQD
jgi:hypothetical protein